MRSVQGEELDPMWLAEFRGYFYGEGFLGIVSWGKHPKGFTKLMPRAQITCREDDVAMLHDICSRLGGFVYTEWDGRKSKGTQGRVYQSNPFSSWRITKVDHIRRVCDILELGVMPAKKIQEVAIMRQFLALTLAPGKRITEEMYRQREELHQQIMALHRYSGS